MVQYSVCSLLLRHCCHVDTSHQLEQATSQLRDEQQQRKQLQTQVTDLQETVAELTRQRDAFEKVLQLYYYEFT